MTNKTKNEDVNNDKDIEAKLDSEVIVADTDVEEVAPTEDQEDKVIGTDDVKADEEESEDADANDDEEEASEDKPDKMTVEASYNAKEKVAVASTNVYDRHGESVSQEGWDLANFKKNPVMLWSHDHTEIAVGKCRNIHIERAGGSPRLVFTPEFHDKTPKAKALKELFEEGWLNSFSVGFIPKDFDGKTDTYIKQELLEISAVNVPANPDARMMSYKSLVSKGADKALVKEAFDIKEETEEPEAKKSVTELMKGALADAIEDDDIMEEKYKKMSPLHDIMWAFSDVYYDEETSVDDFDKLLGEFIVEVNKLVGTDPEDEGDQEEQVIEESAEEKVLDKDSDITEDDDKQVKAQENEETSAAPIAQADKATRAKQSLIKVIARSSEMLIGHEDKDSATIDKHAKIIKRAAEILSEANKKNLTNK